MVEFASATSGHIVLKYEGRTTASLRDPALEAARWVERYKGRIENSETLIVLGIGSGFHIEKLIQQYPNKKIVALDLCKPLVRRDFESANVTAEFCEGEAFTIKSIREAVKGSYTVLPFAPAFLTNARGYQHLTDHLNGRSPDGLFKLVHARWGKENVSSVRALLALDEDQGIHFKHFVDLIQQHPTLPTEEQYLGLALGELFK